jgi:protein-arginine kinase
MHLSPKTLASITKISQLARRYIVVIGIALFGVLAAFLILRTSNTIAAQPSEEKLAEKLQTVSNPRISDETAAVIETLGTQDITIESDLGGTRDNPFAE